MSNVQEHAEVLEKMKENLEAAFREHKHWSSEEKIYKGALQKHFSQQKESVLNVDGMILQERSRKYYAFDPEFYDFLDDQAKLPLAVKISKKMESEYNIGDFRLPETYFLNLQAKKATKQEKARKDEEDEIRKTDLANKFDTEDLVAELRIIKMDVEAAKQQYDSAKEELYNFLLEQNLLDKSLVTDVGTFSLSTNEPEYDIDQLFYADLTQNINLLISEQAEELACIDLFSKTEFAIPYHEPFHYKGLTFTYIDGTLTCNNEEMNGNSFLVTFTTKKDQKMVDELISAGWDVVSGSITVDSNTLFRHCPIQSTKVDALADQGLLTEKDIQTYKKPTGQTTDFFEVIEEVTNDERKHMFMRKRLQRSEVLREREG